jgi:hypothetical protein
MPAPDRAWARRETKCPKKFARYVDRPPLASLSIIRHRGTRVRRVEHLNFRTLPHTHQTRAAVNGNFQNAWWQWRLVGDLSEETPAQSLRESTVSRLVRSEIRWRRILER